MTVVHISLGSGFAYLCYFITLYFYCVSLHQQEAFEKWPIRHNEPPHANSPDVTSGTVASMSTTTTTTMTTTTRDREDRYGRMEWAQLHSSVVLHLISLVLKVTRLRQTSPKLPVLLCQVGCKTST